MPRGRIIFLAIAFFVGGFLFLITPAFAENSDHLVISQIQITGGAGKTSNDFIELFNPTSQSINIKGYRLVKRTQTGATDTLIKSFTDSFFIPSQGYFLWANSDFLDIPILPNATTSATIAADNGIALRFGSNDTGSITDSVAWGEAQNTFVEGAIFPQNADGGQALVRNNNQDTNNNATDFTIAPSSPRHAEASVPPAEPPNTPTPPPETPPPSSSTSSNTETSSVTNCQNTILVNEIMINPEDSNADYEFVELYNQTDIEKDISGWILEDSQGKTTKFTLPANTKIASHSFLTLYRPQTKITLNNSGDGVKLSDATGQICDASPHNSGAADEDMSYSRKNANWVWTSASTPNATNVFVETKSNSTDSSNQKTNDSTSFASTASPATVTASSTIILNEFLPNPKGADAEKEFIELKNISAVAVKLDKWRLEDSSRKKFIFSSSTIIGPNEFLTIWSKDSNISLNNSNDAIKLFNSDGQIVDQTGYNESAEENFSYNRLSASSTVWQWSTVPSPGVENFISEPNHPPTIIFSIPNVAEIGEDIFFDASNSADPEGDKLVFVWNFGDKTEAIGATSTHQYARAGQFKITLTANDYHANEVKERAVITIIDSGETAEDGETASSAKSNKSAAKKWLRVSGAVTVPPGLFGTQYFYLQDNNGRGLQIYMFKKDFPDLKVGDHVEAAGETSETQSGVRVKTKQKQDIKILSGKDAAMPEELAIADLSDENLGGLVKIKGEVLEPKSGKFYVADDSGEILVELKSRAGFKGQIVKEGDIVEVVGILAANKDAFKIWPRFADDIKILESKKEAAGTASSTNAPTNNLISATVGGLGSLLLAYVARSRAALAKGLAMAAISKVAFWKKNKKDSGIS